MLDLKSIESRMAAERRKDELREALIAAEQEYESVVGRFDHLGRQPTLEEREKRLGDFIASRHRLGALRNQLLEL